MSMSSVGRQNMTFFLQNAFSLFVPAKRQFWVEMWRESEAKNAIVSQVVWTAHTVRLHATQKKSRKHGIHKYPFQ